MESPPSELLTGDYVRLVQPPVGASHAQPCRLELLTGTPPLASGPCKSRVWIRRLRRSAALLRQCIGRDPDRVVQDRGDPSSGAPGRGSRMSSSRPSSGSRGTTAAACSPRWGTCPRPSSSGPIMTVRRLPTSWRFSTNELSGKPGAVHRLVAVGQNVVQLAHEALTRTLGFTSGILTLPRVGLLHAQPSVLA
jgi:hypothetical protein